MADFLKWAVRSRPLFLYFCIFNAVDISSTNVLYKIRRRLDLNYGSLVLEATSLATEPQPLHYITSKFALKPNI